MSEQYDRALFEARRLTAEARHRLAVQLMAEMNPGTEDWLRDLGRVGICGDGSMTGTLPIPPSIPGAVPMGWSPTVCSLPAGHAGAHHDSEQDAHWLASGEILRWPSYDKR